MAYVVRYYRPTAACFFLNRTYGCLQFVNLEKTSLPKTETQNAKSRRGFYPFHT